MWKVSKEEVFTVATTRRRITDYLNPQKYFCENFKESNRQNLLFLCLC